MMSTDAECPEAVPPPLPPATPPRPTATPPPASPARPDATDIECEEFKATPAQSDATDIKCEKFEATPVAAAAVNDADVVVVVAAAAADDDAGVAADDDAIVAAKGDDAAAAADDDAAAAADDDAAAGADDDGIVAGAGDDGVAARSKKNFLTLSEKKTIVSEAYEKPMNVKPTAKRHKLQPSQIRRWKRRFEDFDKEQGISSAKKSRMLSGKTLHTGGNRRLDSDTFDVLKVYYENMKNMDRLVTVRTLSQEFKRLANSDASVPALMKRVDRWLKMESIRPKRLGDAQDALIISAFVQRVNNRIELLDYSADDVANIDEVGFFFDLTTVAPAASSPTAAKPPAPRPYGLSLQFTVLLGVTMSGEKLTPLVVFKGMPKGRIAREWTGKSDFPDTLLYTAQENGWVDEIVFFRWIDKVWKPYSNDRAGTRLLMDEYSVHMRPDCAKIFEDSFTEIDFIPSAYTNNLQVIDVGIKPLFKQYVMDSFDQFKTANKDLEGGKASRLDVAKWVDDAWKKIPPAIIPDMWTSIGYYTI